MYTVKAASWHQAQENTDEDAICRNSTHALQKGGRT